VGAWSHEPFGNDSACDWAYKLEESSDLSLIEDTLNVVIDSDAAYLGLIASVVAIGAIEVLAKLKGKGTQTDAYTEKIDKWVSKMNQKPAENTINKAIAVLDIVLAENSKLVEFWNGQEEWFSAINNLKSAVAA